MCELVSYSKVLLVQISPSLRSLVAWLPTTRPTLHYSGNTCYYVVTDVLSEWAGQGLARMGECL